MSPRTISLIRDLSNPVRPPTRFDRLFSGFALAPLKGPIPDWMRKYGNDAAPVFGPEDTMDGDDGRFLDRAMRELLTEARRRLEVRAGPIFPGPGLVRPYGKTDHRLQ